MVARIYVHVQHFLHGRVNVVEDGAGAGRAGGRARAAGTRLPGRTQTKRLLGG